MKNKLSFERVGDFVVGFAFGVFLAITISMWEGMPIAVRVLMIGVLVMAISSPWQPKIPIPNFVRRDKKGD